MTEENQQKQYTYEEVSLLCQEALKRRNENDPLAQPVEWEDAYGMARGFWIHLIMHLLNEVLPEKEQNE
jgi:hypothetical protein